MISDLKGLGYNIQDIVNGNSTVTGITLSKNSVAMSKGSNEDLFYTLTYTQGTARYFVEIEGSYYEVTLENEEFKVNKEKTDIEKIGEKPKVVVTSDKENIVAVALSSEQDKDKIVITSKQELGNAVITVGAENSTVKAICTVKVIIPVTDISLEKETLKVKKGTTQAINASLTPSNATEKLIWTSENEEIATVTEDGIVTGILEGKTKITVTNETKTVTKTCEIEVIIPAEGMDISTSTMTLEKGQTGEITVTITPENTTEPVVWSIDDETVATVTQDTTKDQAGRTATVKAVGTGTATITVTCGEKTAHCAVTVKISATGLSLSTENLTIDQGETVELIAIPTPSNTTDKIKWRPGATSIVTVEEDETKATETTKTANVTGKAIGNTTITVTCGTHSKTCSVTVTKPVAKVGTISEATHTAQDLSNQYTWDEMAILAEAIAKNSSIKWDKTEEVKLTIRSTPYTIGVGDRMKVDGKVVRILGFNHDEMSESQKKTAYDGTCTTAGISFEYVDFITENKAMNSTTWTKQGSDGGWKECELRNTLNGTVYSELPNTNSPKNYIKEVTKSYCAQYDSATLSYCDDKLWILSGAEIWNNGYYSTGKGCSRGVEGKQYKYYKKINAIYNREKNELKKPSNIAGTSGSGTLWWIRSPYFYRGTTFGYVDSTRDTIR